MIYILYNLLDFIYYVSTWTLSFEERSFSFYLVSLSFSSAKKNIT
jgi:hypothetical protein